MAKPEYVSVSPTSGTGDGIVDVKLPEYSGRATRGGILTITTAGGAKKTVNISQHGEESLSVAETSKSAAAAGETVKIAGTSNCAAIRVDELQQINGAAYQLSVNGTPVPDWDGRDSIQITDDPGASGSYGFELSVTVPENQTEASRSLRFRLSDGGEAIQSDIVTIEQTAGTKTYGKPVITGFSYSGDIPASGGSLMPELAFEQSWGWNGATDGGGTVTDGGGWTFRAVNDDAPADVLDISSGKVTAANLGMAITGRNAVIEVGATVSANGQTSEESTCQIYQEANAVKEFSDITIGADENVTLSGAGEDYEINPDAHQTAILTSGETMDENTPGTAVAFECSYSVISPMDGFSLTGNRVTAEPNPSTLVRGGFKVFVIVKGAELEGERKSATKTITFNQSGSGSELSVSPDSLEYEAAGGTAQLEIISNDSWTIS